jgi:hypothetical protein
MSSAVVTDRESYGMLKIIRISPVRLRTYLIGRGLSRAGQPRSLAADWAVPGIILARTAGYPVAFAGHGDRVVFLLEGGTGPLPGSHIAKLKVNWQETKPLWHMHLPSNIVTSQKPLGHCRASERASPSGSASIAVVDGDLAVPASLVNRARLRLLWLVSPPPFGGSTRPGVGSGSVLVCGLEDNPKT